MMSPERLSVRIMMILVLLSLTTGAWALDADDQDSADGSKQDTTSKTEDATAGPPNYVPPHDEHPDQNVKHPIHKSGGSRAPRADLAGADAALHE